MGIILDKTARIPSLEDGKQYQFLGVLESVMQHYELVLECAAKEYLRQMSVVWTNAMLYLPHEKGVDVTIGSQWNIKPRIIRVRLDPILVETWP